MAARRSNSTRRRDVVGASGMLAEQVSLASDPESRGVIP